MASTINVKIAPLPRGEYSSSATYAKLDVVSYNGSSYMAIKAVPTGTVPTNTTYWQLLAEKPTIGEGSITTDMLADGAVTDAKLAQTGGVLEEIAELENSTKNVVIERISANLLDPNYLNIGKTVQWNTGEISENANYVVWLWIPVIAGKQIFFSRGNGVGQAPATVCYYGAEKNYLGYITINATTGATIPNNAVYICMSLGKAAYNNFADSWMLQYDLITLYRPYYERFSTRLIRNNPFVLSVAHQGYHEKAPNQTLSAYKSAFDYGFGTIECDINFTSDGELICCHNETVYADADNMVINPTLGTSTSPYTTAINVQSENLSTLQGYSWGAWRGAEFADETVLLFDDLMAYAKQKMLNVIIDDAYRVANDQTLFEAFTNIIDKYGMASYCYVTSVGNIVSEWNSKAKVIFGVSTYSDITDVSQLLAFMTNNPEAEGWVAMPYAQLTDAASKELHENGIKIYVYTIDSVDDICSKMLYADAICSNIYTVEDAMAIKGL